MVEYMKRKVIIYIALISVLFMGCGKIEIEKLSSSVIAEPTEKMKPVATAAPATRLGNDVDAIMDALRFWINKEAWEYGTEVSTAYLGDDIVFKDFLDTELTVKIYYRTVDSYYDDPKIETRRDDNELVDIIDFYISSGKEKDSYIYLSLIEGEHGFTSEPEPIKRTKKIEEDDLIYLAEENFYFSSKEMTRPDFPVSDQKKELFLKKAKKEIKTLLSDEQGIYQVYIKNFTNQDRDAEVYIIDDGKEIRCHTILREILMDNGILDTDAAYLSKCTASYDWTDKDTREGFKKTLELSILEFEVKVHK